MFEGHRNTDANATILTQSVRSMMQTVCKLSKLSVFTYPPSRINIRRCKLDLCLMSYNFEPKCMGEEFAAGYWDWDRVRKGIWNCGKYMTQTQCLFDLAILPDEKTDENTITWLVQVVGSDCITKYPLFSNTVLNWEFLKLLLSRLWQSRKPEAMHQMHWTSGKHHWLC